MLVYTLVIICQFDICVRTCSSKAIAQGELVKFIKSDWDIDEDMPALDSELIYQYFEMHEGYSYELIKNELIKE